MKTGVTIFLSLLWCGLTAQPVYFSEPYSFAQYTIGGAIVQRPDSGYSFVCNNVLPFGYSFVSTDKRGDTLFTKTYSDTCVNRFFLAGNTNALICTVDSNYVACGSYDDCSNNRTGFIAKFAPDGDTLWTARIGSVGFDALYSVGQQPNGDLWFAGSTDSWGNGQRDFWLLALSNSGVYLWDTTYGAAFSEEALSGKLCSDGGMLISGKRGNFPCVARIDSARNLEWMYTYATFKNAGYATQFNDSEYVVASSKLWSSTETQICLFKLDKDGMVVWDRIFGFAQSEDISQTLPVVTSDGIAIGGTSNLSWQWGPYTQYYFAKTDLNGYMLWQRMYEMNDSSGYHQVSDLKQTSDNGFVLSGSCAISGNAGVAWLLKLDSLGCDSVNCAGVGYMELNMTTLDEPFPNPAVNGFSIAYHFQNEYGGNMIVWNVQGQMVFTEKCRGKSGTLYIETSSWAKGIYMLSLTDENGIAAHRKIVVQ